MTGAPLSVTRVLSLGVALLFAGLALVTLPRRRPAFAAEGRHRRIR